MSNFFEAISKLFEFIAGPLGMLSEVFVTIGKGFVYMTAAVSYLPDYILPIASMIIAIAIVLNIFNRGA